MANRVLLGLRGSQYGLWVSKPGQNVLTAVDPNLLFSIDDKAFQVVQSGAVVFNSAAYIDITIPNLGYYPLATFTYKQVNNMTFYIEYLSFTTIRFNRSHTTADTRSFTYYVMTCPVGF
jgi:hypothetical protein